MGGIQRPSTPLPRSFAKKHDPFHPLGQEIFSLTFVAAYQTLLIWAFSALPVWVVSEARAPLGVSDALLALAGVAALAGETWTDNVQWAFQMAKHARTPAERAAAGGDFARGFCTSGPFRYTRHLSAWFGGCTQAM